MKTDGRLDRLIASQRDRPVAPPKNCVNCGKPAKPTRKGQCRQCYDAERWVTMMSTKHQLTPVQRKVLRWLREAGGQLRMQTGHKTTALVEGDHDDAIILCQSLVPFFLLHHGYIERVNDWGYFRLTEKGRQRTQNWTI